MARRFPIGVFFLVLGAAVAVMAVEAAAHLVGTTQLSTADAHRILGGLARSHTQLLAVMFISVAVAVPVTSNQYTPKLLRVFISDRTHVAVLSTYAMTAAHANWALYAARRGEVSEGLVDAVLATSCLAFVLVVPYFFYVIAFLEPHSLVQRIRAQGTRAIRRTRESADDSAKMRLGHALHDLGSLVLRSLDHGGRESAELGIVALRELVDDYGRIKEPLPADWFGATKAEFRGLSREALAFISEERSWVEVTALRDLGRAFDAAVARMPDAVVLVADTVRGIGEDAHRRDDEAVVRNAVRALNSMLRTAINARQPRVVFDVLLQYGALAEACLVGRPKLTGEIAEYYARYGVRARRVGLEFIPELFVYDLGSLLEVTIRQGSPAQEDVLDAIDDLSRQLATAPTVPAACALLVLLGKSGEGLGAEARDRVLDRIEDLPASIVLGALAVIDAAESPRYHELSSRQVDVNHLSPDARERVRQLVASRIEGVTRR